MATATEVRLIMKKTVTQLSDAQAAPFIAAAENLITSIITKSISDDLLADLEVWLSAHMIASTILRMTSEEALGDASVKYAGKWGEGLKSTPYGQMVLILDTTGLLAAAEKRKASIYAVPNFD
jgi:hypothetical protein